MVEIKIKSTETLMNNYTERTAAQHADIEEHDLAAIQRNVLDIAMKGMLENTGLAWDAENSSIRVEDPAMLDGSAALNGRSLDSMTDLETEREIDYWLDTKESELAPRVEQAWESETIRAQIATASSHYEQIQTHIQLYDMAEKDYAKDLAYAIDANNGTELSDEQEEAIAGPVEYAKERLEQEMDRHILFLTPEQAESIRRDERLDGQFVDSGLFEGFGTDIAQHSPGMNTIHERLHDCLGEAVIEIQEGPSPERADAIEKSLWEARQAIQENYMELTQTEKEQLSEYAIVREHGLDAPARMQYLLNDARYLQEECTKIRENYDISGELAKDYQDLLELRTYELQHAKDLVTEHYRKHAEQLTPIEREAFAKGKDAEILGLQEPLLAENLKMSEMESAYTAEETFAMAGMERGFHSDKEEMKLIMEAVGRLPAEKNLDEVAVRYQYCKDRLTAEEQAYVKEEAAKAFTENPDPRSLEMPPDGHIHADYVPGIPDYAAKEGFDTGVFLEKANVYEITAYHESRQEKQLEFLDGAKAIRDAKEAVTERFRIFERETLGIEEKPPYEKMLHEAEKLANSKDVSRFMGEYYENREKLTEEQKDAVFRHAEENLKKEPTAILAVPVPERAKEQDFHLRELVEKGDVGEYMKYEDSRQEAKERSFHEGLERLRTKIAEKAKEISDALKERFGIRTQEPKGPSMAYRAISNSISSVESEVQKYENAVKDGEGIQEISHHADCARTCQEDLRDRWEELSKKLRPEEKKELETKMEQSKLMTIRGAGHIKAELRAKEYNKTLQLRSLAAQEKIRVRTMTKETMRAI